MIYIFLEKYSDWLEAYSVLVDYPEHDLCYFYIENDRNDGKSMENIFMEFVSNEKSITSCAFATREEFLKSFPIFAKKLNKNDVLVAPFIRYKELWFCVSKINKGVITVHLSECLPDSFGHLGYRIAYRGKFIKTWITLPFMKLFAMINSPSLCYYPLYPLIQNPFVKKNKPIHIPKLTNSKRLLINKLLGEDSDKRTLIIGGFGYDPVKMANFLKIQKYIATTKGPQIIIDGITYPLEERICAEEVLLSGKIEKIISYTSSAVVWGKLLDSRILIECYLSNVFKEAYGPFYNLYAKKVLAKIGIITVGEEKSMFN